jgi:hypothetical protein
MPFADFRLPRYFFQVLLEGKYNLIADFRLPLEGNK